MASERFFPFLRLSETERVKGRDCQYKVSRRACYKELQPRTRTKPQWIRIWRTVKFSSPNFPWRCSWNNISQNFPVCIGNDLTFDLFRTSFVKGTNINCTAETHQSTIDIQKKNSKIIFATKPLSKILYACRAHRNFLDDKYRVEL